jgi:hypothetical protein
LAAIGASIDAICGAGKDEIGIVRMHKNGKCFDLAQRVFPVSAVGRAAKDPGETALFAGVIATNTGEHIRWGHDTFLPARFCAMIFCREQPDNVVFIVSRRVLDEYRPRGVSPRLSMAQCHQSERVTNTGVIRGHLLRPE